MTPGDPLPRLQGQVALAPVDGTHVRRVRGHVASDGPRIWIWLREARES